VKRNPAARNSKKGKDAKSVLEIRSWLNCRLEEEAGVRKFFRAY
jgi:hypothetical protein